ncbi:hypothetical protein OPQ81_005797 [Rhizoctonia solani]|nr:hypothetical protein OPQ81_005797 [Rhizoctonia solani]
MSSAFSDVESVVSLTDHKHSNADTALAENAKPIPPVHPEFAFPDGNIELQFSRFAALIQAAKSSETISGSGHRVILLCDERTTGEDIYNTLKVIYASHIDGIPDFDSSVMISTLRIASSFDYPALRKFVVSKIEGMNLPAIQRIQLSDEFSLPTWEMPAFTELCSRKEPISSAEAEVLGMARFVEIARIRETERTRSLWAAEFAEGIKRDFLQVLDDSLQLESSDNSKYTENELEYCSGRSELPKCCTPSFKRGSVAAQAAYSEAPDLEMELSRASWIRRLEVPTP